MNKPFLMNFSKKEIDLHEIGGDMDFRTNMKRIFGVENLQLDNQQATVVIFSRIHDSEADLVCVELAKKNINYIRLNADYFPSEYKFKYIQSPDGTSRLILKYKDEMIDFSYVKVVWYRHFDTEAFNFTTSEDIALRYVKKEWDNFLRSISLVLDCVWINHPSAINDATKMLQLKKATEVGFDIPHTLVTNDNESVKEVFSTNESLIVKVLDSHHVEYKPGKLFTTHAHILSSDEINTISSLIDAPVTFQPFIDDHEEVRVTIVGNKIFASKLMNKPDDNDWHNKPIQDMKLTEYKLTKEVEDKCLRLLSIMELQYGAIDLLLTKDKVYFLEVNTIGDWRWVEHSTGQNIALEVVNQLISYVEVNYETTNI